MRLDPQTGAALPDNPLFGGAKSDDDPIIAYGLRNPFRFVIDQKTGEIWIGDVGWRSYEEINHIPSPADAVVENFGWPCYEGPLKQPNYDAHDVPICENLYQTPAGTVTSPILSYHHNQPPNSPTCGLGAPTSAISGVTLYTGDDYPANLHDALIFVDYPFQCIYAVPRGQNGQPDPAQIFPLVSQTVPITDLTTGPGGDIFYVAFPGSIRRLSPVNRLFMDGFESGDTGRWSFIVP